jgi:hypothetical protein
MAVLKPLAFALSLLATSAALAADKEPTTVSFFGELQERGPSTPEELAERDKTLSAEVSAADAALNDWKLCVTDALARWADLGQGPGTLVDGAFGRCGDQVRLYRDKLIKVTQNGRQLLDLQFARAMVKGLEESWRLRLVAMALDQEMVRRAKALPTIQPLPKSR